jgi:uncharacterized protein (TIGR00730 family)
MQRICVFCGSSVGVRPVYREAAECLGRTLVRRGLGMVFGGGRIGLMGVLANAVLEAGGEAIGVIPQSLMDKELGHLGLTELRVVGSMHERKAMMAELSDAFIALPGGYGTLDEFCEVVTWSQLGLHRKPCGMLNVDGYYDPILALFDHAVREEFIRPSHRGLILVDADAGRLLDVLADYQPPELQKWIDRDEV